LDFYQIKVDKNPSIILNNEATKCLKNVIENASYLYVLKAMSENIIWYMSLYMEGFDYPNKTQASRAIYFWHNYNKLLSNFKFFSLNFLNFKARGPKIFIIDCWIWWYDYII
jgi:hypothetical protein